MKSAIILMGPPGAGKGTQAVAIQRHAKLEHIATGDILRGEVTKASNLGKQAQQYIDRGELVPSPLVVQMIAAFIQKGTTKNGFLFDGFPRSLDQAKALEPILASNDIQLKCVLNISVPEAVLLQRIAIRADTETPRTDDNQQVLKQRLQVYEKQTKPLLDYYRSLNLLCEINGNQPRDQVFAAICHKLGPAA